jgi:uncharacterized protein YjbI with pentapeptide repeats
MLDPCGVDLNLAILNSADIRRANLTGAKLRSVNFTGASVDGADLAGEDLNRANLQSPGLQRTILVQTILKKHLSIIAVAWHHSLSVPILTNMGCFALAYLCCSNRIYASPSMNWDRSSKLADKVLAFLSFGKSDHLSEIQGLCLDSQINLWYKIK